MSVGSSMDTEHYLLGLVALLILLTPIQCLQIEEDWVNRGVTPDDVNAPGISIDAYEEFIRLDPKNATAWYGKGNALLYGWGRSAEAIEAYDEAIAKFDFNDSRIADAWYSKGEAFRSQGDDDAAIECYNKATELSPDDAAAWYAKGDALNGQEENNEAAWAYSEVIRIEPNNTDAWLAEGAMLDRLERYEDAIRCYDEAIRIDPNNTRAWTYKADSLEDQGKSTEATKVNDEANKLKRNTAMDWFNKGVVHDRLGEISNATSAYQQAVRTDPTFAKAWYNLGMDLYAVSGRMNTYDRSMRCFAKAAALDPKLDIWRSGGLLLRVETQSDWEYWREIHAIRHEA